MTRPYYEAVYGGLSCGKSSYVMSIIDIPRTFKLGCGNWFFDILNTRLGAVRSHEEENRRLGLEFKTTTPNRIVQDVSNLTKPILLIDDWTSLHRYTYFWPYERISKQCDETFNAIDHNRNLERVVFVAWDAQTFLPFGWYKKRGLWNRKLFAVADKITKFEYGIPIKIK